MGLRNPKHQGFQIVLDLVAAEYKYLPLGLSRDLAMG